MTKGCSSTGYDYSATFFSFCSFDTTKFALCGSRVSFFTTWPCEEKSARLAKDMHISPVFGRKPSHFRWNYVATRTASQDTMRINGSSCATRMTKNIVSMVRFPGSISRKDIVEKHFKKEGNADDCLTSSTVTQEIFPQRTVQYRFKNKYYKMNVT